MLELQELPKSETNHVSVLGKSIPPEANEPQDPSSISEHWQQDLEEREESTSSPLLADNGYPDQHNKNVIRGRAREVESQSLPWRQPRKQRKSHAIFSKLLPPADQAALLFCILLAFSVFVVNLAFTLWAIIHTGSGNSLVGVYSGQCDTVQKISIWVHLLLNILATILLGASNHAMQRLCAPSRSDVDLRHRAHRHATIGSTDVRNLVGRRLWLYVLLSASSLPIHLL